MGSLSNMALTDTRLAVLLLLFAVTFPLQAIAGRQPSAASRATLVQTRSPQVQVPAATDTRDVGLRDSEVEAWTSMTLEDDAKFQARSSPSQRKMNRQGSPSYNSKQVRDEVDVHGHRLQVGSSAPTCQGKCGQCNPCNPIHMTIGTPHGTLTQQEYYPEVWRCKCGGVYFMP